MSAAKFYLLFNGFICHPLIIVIQTQFATLSGHKALIVSFLTDAEVPISTPIAIVVVVWVNSVSSTTNLWLGEHELVVASLVQQRLVRSICHHLVRDVERWTLRSLPWRAVVRTSCCLHGSLSRVTFSWGRSCLGRARSYYSCLLFLIFLKVDFLYLFCGYALLHLGLLDYRWGWSHDGPIYGS